MAALARPGAQPVQVTDPRLRWARASAERGVFCDDPAHARSDYVFLEPQFPARRGDATPPKPIGKWACGICWPRGQNRNPKP